MAMKMYSTFAKVQGLETHSKMQFHVIIRTFVVGGLAVGILYTPSADGRTIYLLVPAFTLVGLNRLPLEHLVAH